jgi:resolvase-like protein
VALYLSVSTNKRQTIANQRRELDALAQRNGWHVVKVFKDKGKRGAKGDKGGQRGRSTSIATSPNRRWTPPSSKALNVDRVRAGSK